MRERETEGDFSESTTLTSTTKFLQQSNSSCRAIQYDISHWCIRPVHHSAIAHAGHRTTASTPIHALRDARCARCASKRRRRESPKPKPKPKSITNQAKAKGNLREQDLEFSFSFSFLPDSVWENGNSIFDFAFIAFAWWDRQPAFEDSREPISIVFRFVRPLANPSLSRPM